VHGFTAAAGINDRKFATTQFVQTAIQNSQINLTDTTLKGDVKIDPKTNASGQVTEGVETTLTINSAHKVAANGTSRTSAIYLTNADASGKMHYSQDNGLWLTTTAANPISFNPTNTGTAAMTINSDKNVVLLKDVTAVNGRFTGVMTGKVHLSNSSPNGGVAIVSAENTSATGYARMELKTPPGSCYLQAGKRADTVEGRCAVTKGANPIRFYPNEALTADFKDTESKFLTDVVCERMLTTKNTWMFRSLLNVPYSQADREVIAVFGWKRLEFIHGGPIPQQGTEVGSNSFWDGASAQNYIIRKNGVYSFRCTVNCSYPAEYDRYFTSTELRVIIQPSGRPASDSMILTTDIRHKIAAITCNRASTVDAYPLVVGDRLWAQFRTGMRDVSEGVTSPCLLNGHFRLRLVN